MMRTLVSLLSVCAGTCGSTSSAHDTRLLLVAHRGGVVEDGRIENNRPAIEEAIARGYAMIEVDVRESADGHAIVHHDTDFVRYYADPRRVADLSWEEIRGIRDKKHGSRPLDFAEFCEVCRGRVRLMVDTKGPDHEKEFFESMRASLDANGLLDSAFVIGTEQSKNYFGAWAKTSVDAEGLQRALSRGETVRDRYFLFEHGDMTADSVRRAQKHGVEVVPSVNVFHYPDSDHRERAAADIRRLVGLGVRWFQIDSAYEALCRDAVR